MNGIRGSGKGVGDRKRDGTARERRGATKNETDRKTRKEERVGREKRGSKERWTTERSSNERSKSSPERNQQRKPALCRTLGKGPNRRCATEREKKKETQHKKKERSMVALKISSIDAPKGKGRD